jgi:hypothetical protein
MAKIKKRVATYYSFYCPGCKHEHSFMIAEDNSQWWFNGNLERPSFTPSLLNVMKIKNEVTGVYNIEKERCHLIITDGMIHFQTDCQHELAGQIIELPEV